jgi:hypothetical protein
LGNLIKTYPELKIYFRDIHTDDPADGVGLTAHALDTQFKFFEEIYQMPLDALHTLPVSNLCQQIERLMQDDCEMPPTGFAIYNDIDEIDLHYVPVFIIKDHRKVHVFIFDSKGHVALKDPQKREISVALSTLIDHFRHIDDPERLAIYSYQIKRQNSAVGCATFTVLDLKNLIERSYRSHESLLNFYSIGTNRPRLITQELENDASLIIYELSTLPPEMMKVTQSFRKLMEYKQHPPALPQNQIPEFNRFTTAGTVEQKLQDFQNMNVSIEEIRRVFQDGSERNLYIEQKRLSDITNLLAYHFQLPLKTARRQLSFFELQSRPRPQTPQTMSILDILSSKN